MKRAWQSWPGVSNAKSGICLAILTLYVAELTVGRAQRGRFFRAGAVVVPPEHQKIDVLPKGNIYDTK